MPTYIAQYRSPQSGAERCRGSFEYESEARAGSKQNARDARMTMLKEFGNEAVPWTIESVELKKNTSNEEVDGQFQFDFRDPLPETRVRKTVQRGKV